jgi:DNA invertase Pin-like site-specific DNA recombinase
MFANSKALWDEANRTKIGSTPLDPKKPICSDDTLPDHPRLRSVIFNRDVKNGFAISEIARIYGVSRAYVKYHTNESPREIKKDVDKEIILLVNENKTWSFVCKKLNCSKDHVKYVMRKHRKEKGLK